MHAPPPHHAPPRPQVTGARVVLAIAAALVGGAVVIFGGPYQAVRAAAGRALPEEMSTGPAAVTSFLTALGEAGRERYATFQYLDLLNPVLLPTALALLLLWLAARARLPGRLGRALLLLPLTLALADLGENLLLLGAIGRYPAPGPLAALLPHLTTLKFAALMATGPVAVVLVGLAVARRGVRQAA